MIREGDIEHLACPDCPGVPLQSEGARLEKGRVVSGDLACESCGSSFPVVDGIPYLMPAALHAARRHGHEIFPEEWRRWGERLQGFREWRERTWTRAGNHERVRSERLAEARRDAFAAFCGVIDGRALEVGCGDGSLSRARSFRAREYWGVDPMPIEGVEYGFPFVAGVGERLPFRNGAFGAVLVKESLHHLQDPGRVLDEARRVTAAGGSLLLCQGIETRDDAAAGAPRRILQRAATAARLALSGRFAEIRERAERALGGSSPIEGAGGAGGGARGEAPAAHYLWRLTREDVEFEVRGRYEVAETRVEGGCLYLRGRA